MSDFELLRDLRALRRDAEPGVDLWPSIAKRIAAPARAPRRTMWPEALAASVLLGVCTWLALGIGVRVTESDGLAWSLREARALDASYGGAVLEARAAVAPPSGPLAAADRELVAAQQALEDALARQPDSRHLLDLLRRTHEQRLRLAQRQLRVG